MVSSELLEKHGFKEEHAEKLPGIYGNTGFPKPIKTYHLMWEVYDLSIEEPYFWILDQLKESFPIVEKLEDSFAAAENSAFFGVTQVRLGGQQDKITQLLTGIGTMVKQLFQIVRELRIIDERLTYYREAEAQGKKPMERRGKGADVTLKGIFVDLVQGGGKSPASVYGMARELEFVTLPDLFFDAPPFKSPEELDKHVDRLGENFNQNVLRVLRRHLRQFLEWKKRTYKEHVQRRKFQLAYLGQHFEIIKMYITWIKPYLRHVRKLHLKEGKMDSPDIVAAFEGSMLDVELLARKQLKGKNGCILATFNYRTRAELKVQQEGYQRGPVHIGRMNMYLRLYGWTDKQVDAYKKLKEEETLHLMGNVSGAVEEAMNSLGKELFDYLAEAKGVKTEPEKKDGKKEEKQNKSLMKRLLGDFYHSNSEKKSLKESQKAEEEVSADDSVVMHAKAMCWVTYHNFKKAHRMVAW